MESLSLIIKHGLFFESKHILKTGLIFVVHVEFVLREGNMMCDNDK